MIGYRCEGRGDTLWYPQPITIRQTEGPELWTRNMMNKKDEILRLFVQRLRKQLGGHVKTEKDIVNRPAIHFL